MQFPHFIQEPLMNAQDHEVRELRLRGPPNELFALVTTTKSLAVARKWIRAMGYRGPPDQPDLRVGMAFHGNVVVINIGSFQRIYGAFATFLKRPNVTLVGLGPEPHLGRDMVLGNYRDLARDGRRAVASVEDLVPGVFGDNSGVQIPAIAPNYNWSWPLQEPALIYACMRRILRLLRIGC